MMRGFAEFNDCEKKFRKILEVQPRNDVPIGICHDNQVGALTKSVKHRILYVTR
jgi:hypothetical protein